MVSSTIALVTGLCYENNLLWSGGHSPDDQGSYLFWDDQRRDLFALQNSIIIFNEANDHKKRGVFNADYNAYVNAIDMP